MSASGACRAEHIRWQLPNASGLKVQGALGSEQHFASILALVADFLHRFENFADAFSKKVENLEDAVALHYMHYTFCRIHQTLRVTPAMEAGVTDHVWEIREVVALID